jgi:hypothetical protein
MVYITTSMLGFGDLVGLQNFHSRKNLLKKYVPSGRRPTTSETGQNITKAIANNEYQRNG